jgi:hypothetical protein
LAHCAQSPAFGSRFTMLIYLQVGQKIIDHNGSQQLSTGGQ